jgi:TonB family protein
LEFKKVKFYVVEDKKYHMKALLVSLIAHVSVFLIFLSVGDRVIQANKPIIIDFSIEGADGEGQRSSGHKAAMEENRRAGSVRNHDIKGNNTKIERKEVAAAGSKEISVSQISTPIDRSTGIEAETPVLIPVGGNTHYTSEGDLMSASVEASAGSVGGLSEGGNAAGIGTGFGGGHSGVGSGGGGRGEKARYLKENFAYIRDLIQKRVVYPSMARRMGWQGSVKVSFIIFADGFAKGVNIIQTSGIEVLDMSAIKAVKDASPFPKPPCEAQIIIPLVYKLN